ncbi:hypothetical protein GQ457_08G017750 [Hibiscus cannabinus]
MWRLRVPLKMRVGAGVEDVTEGANVEVEGVTEGASVGVEGAGAGVEGASVGLRVPLRVEGAGVGVEGVTKGSNVEVEGVGVGIEGVLEGASVGVEGVGIASSIEIDNEGGYAEIEGNANENDSDDYNIDENESSLASCDEEEDEATLRRKNPKYNQNSERPQFCLGMLFTDGKEFKTAIYKYSRCSRRELKIMKNEPKRINVKCIASAKCPWRVYASKNRQTMCIHVKTFINEHNCPVSFKNKTVSMKVIAEHFEDTIKDHPKMKIKEIQRRIQSELHVNVPNARCRRAKSLVTSRLTGSCKEEFALLWDYIDDLRTKNPGSIIKMAVNRVSDISSPHFKRFYVYFDALKRGWKEGYKPIMGLDGSFLKGVFKGVLLGAVGRDGNDQMYPIAWAVAEGESTDSLSWFLSLVSTDLGMEDGFGYTIISGQHKSTTEREWEDNKQVLSKLDEKVAAELFGKQEKKWTKAFQGLHAISDIVDNNMCEVFNSSIIEARYKSIITMLEEIRVKIMTRIVEKRHFISTWKYNYGPLIKKKFDVIKKDSVAWRMVWNGKGGCEVKKGRKYYLVNLNEKTCSCRRWQLCGIPCQHACCAIWYTGGDPYDYLHSCYLKDT